MVSERRKCRSVVRSTNRDISPEPTMTVPSESDLANRGTPVFDWPFPTHPLKAWTKKQEEQYQQQQRNKLPEALL